MTTYKTPPIRGELVHILTVRVTSTRSVDRGDTKFLQRFVSKCVRGSQYCSFWVFAPCTAIMSNAIFACLKGFLKKKKRERERARKEKWIKNIIKIDNLSIFFLWILHVFLNYMYLWKLVINSAAAKLLAFIQRIWSEQIKSFELLIN